jgi:hypothetical protein
MDDRPQISFPFPIKGVTENSAYGTVPEGFALDALNVVSFDVLERRLRGGKRPGTGRAMHSPVDVVGAAVQRMKQVTLDSAEFTDAAGFFDDPFFDIGSGPTGDGFGGGWGFPRTDWDFTLNPSGPGGFGTHGIDPESPAVPSPPVIVWLESFPYPAGNLPGSGSWIGTGNPQLGVTGRRARMLAPFTFANSDQSAQIAPVELADLDVSKSFTISFRVFVPETPNGTVASQYELYDASVAFQDGGGTSQLILSVIAQTLAPATTRYVLRVVIPSVIDQEYAVTPGAPFTVTAAWDAGTETLYLSRDDTLLDFIPVASWPSSFSRVLMRISGGYAPSGGAFGFEPRRMDETYIDSIIIRQDSL